MASTYLNDLRIEEQAVGENNGTWGTKLNAALSQISEGFSYGTKQLSADSDQTLTMPDGTSDGTRAIYLKITSAVSLTATRVVTLGPNTVSKLWIVENATTGSQSISIKQGSGATVTIPNGQNKVLYTDGAGSGAAVVDAFTGLSIPSLYVSGNIDVDGTANLDAVDIDGAVDMASTLTLADDLTVDSGTLFVDVSANRVGVNSTAPSYELDVQAATDPSIRVMSTGTASGDDALMRIQIGGTSAKSLLYFGDNDSSAQGRLRYDHSDDSLEIYTNGTEAMHITSAQDIGLGGTPSAGYRLDVIDSGATSARIRSAADSDVSQYFYSAGTTAIHSLFFGDTGNSAAGSIRYYHSDDKLIFNGKGNGGEMARFDSSGRLGIGTTAPAYTLDVDSTVHVGNDGGSGFTHSRVILDANGAARGTGTFFHNQVNDVEWFAGNPYNASDSWSINRQATASHADSTANVTNALMSVDSSGNVLIGGTSTPSSSVGNLALFNGTAPSGSVTNGIVLYAEDVSSSSELRVRDEAGNVTTLSPHNFELIPEGPSEDMAWSYFSEKDGKRINVDMLRAIRVLERLSGEQLVFES